MKYAFTNPKAETEIETIKSGGGAKKKELEWNWKVIICKKQIVFHFEIMSEWASERKMGNVDGRAKKKRIYG